MVIATMKCISGKCDDQEHVALYDVNPADTDKVYDVLTYYAERGATLVAVETDEGDLLGLLVEKPADGTNIPKQWRMEETLMFFAFNPN